MGLNIDKEVAQMRRMTVRELQTKFAQVCGEQPRSHNRQWMVKRAWPGNFRRVNTVVLRNLRCDGPRRLPIRAKYKGQTLCVQVLSDGFIFEGERFKSLSAVARQITGSAWNGFLFFGLAKKGTDA